MELLLQNGASVNEETPDGDNALMVAVMTGDAKVLNAIWHYRGNALLNAANEMGETVLHSAAGKNWDSCVNFLLSNGADPNAQDVDISEWHQRLPPFPTYIRTLTLKSCAMDSHNKLHLDFLSDSENSHNQLYQEFLSDVENSRDQLHRDMSELLFPRYIITERLLVSDLTTRTRMNKSRCDMSQWSISLRLRLYSASDNNSIQGRPDADDDSSQTGRHEDFGQAPPVGADILVESETGLSAACVAKNSETLMFLFDKMTEKEREIFVKYRVERLRCPLCTDFEAYYQETCFPLLQALVRRYEFRDAIYRYKLIPNMLSSVPHLLKNLILVSDACQVFCFTMYHQATFVEERFALQFVRSRGPEFCLKASRLCAENTKVAIETSLLCFLPIVCIAEIPVGKSWLESNCVKVSPFVEKYRLKSLGIAHDNEEVTFKSKILWKRFTDFFDKIQAKHREQNLKELLEEEDRNNAKRIKKREKRKQKRQRQQKTDIEDSSDDDKRCEGDKSSQHSGMPDTIDAKRTLTEDQESAHPPTVGRTKRDKRTMTQKPRHESDSSKTEVAEDHAKQQSQDEDINEKIEFVESMAIGDQWVTVQGKKCKRNGETDASQNCKTKRGRNKKNKNSTIACKDETSNLEAQVPTQLAKVAEEKTPQPESKKRNKISENPGSNFGNKNYEDEFPSLSNQKETVSYSTVVNKSTRNPVTSDMKSGEDDRSSCTGTYSDVCGSESGLSRASSVSHQGDNGSHQGDNGSWSDQETANCGVIFGSESLQNILKSDRKIADLRASNMAAPAIPVELLTRPYFTSDVTVANRCERSTKGAEADDSERVHQGTCPPRDACSDRTRDIPRVQRDSNHAGDLSTTFPPFHQIAPITTRAQHMGTQKEGQNQGIPRTLNYNQAVSENIYNQLGMASGGSHVTPMSVPNPPPGMQPLGIQRINDWAYEAPSHQTNEAVLAQMSLLRNILQERSRQMQMSMSDHLGRESMEPLRQTNPGSIASLPSLGMVNINKPPPTYNREQRPPAQPDVQPHQNYKQDSTAEKINLDSNFVMLDCRSPVGGNTSEAESEFLQYWASGGPNTSCAMSAVPSSVSQEISDPQRTTDTRERKNATDSALLVSATLEDRQRRPDVMKGMPDRLESHYPRETRSVKYAANAALHVPSLDIGQSLLKNTGHLVNSPYEINAEDVLFPNDLRSPPAENQPSAEKPLVFPGFHDNAAPAKEQRKESVPTLIDQIRLAQLQSYYQSFAENSLIKDTAYFHDFYYYASCLGLDYSTIFKYAGDKSLLDEKPTSKCNLSTDKYDFGETCRSSYARDRNTAMNTFCPSRPTDNSLYYPAQQTREWDPLNTHGPSGTTEASRYPLHNPISKCSDIDPSFGATGNSMLCCPLDGTAKYTLVNAPQPSDTKENHTYSSIQTYAPLTGTGVWAPTGGSPPADMAESRGVSGALFCAPEKSSGRDTLHLPIDSNFSITESQFKSDTVALDDIHVTEVISSETRSSTTTGDSDLGHLPQLCDEIPKDTPQDKIDNPDVKAGKSAFRPKGKSTIIADAGKATWEPRSRRWKDKLRELRGLAESMRTQIGDIIIPTKIDDKYMITNSNDPVVLGFLSDGSEIAVRIINTDTTPLNVGHLQKLVDPDMTHYFLIKYKAFAVSGPHCYLAMDLFEYTLDEYMKILRLDHRYDPISANRLAWQMLKGLACLHEQFFMLHGNLTPSNVLVNLQGKLQLSHYGFENFEDVVPNNLDTSRFHDQRRCWEASEILACSGTHTPSSDIQVAGMLIHYILTGGKHPFGDNTFEIQLNLCRGWLKPVYISEEANELIGAMLTPDASQRPSASNAQSHPYFWADEKRLRFILIAGSDVLRDMKAGCLSDPTAMIYHLNEYVCDPLLVDWMSEVDSLVMKDMRTFRHYKGCLSDLVLFVYNCCLHFDKLSSGARSMLGDPCKYFLSKFPTLFMSVYRAILASDRMEKSCYKPFFYMST
ncbi:hypothetical protein ScPMuIL_001003 [Solemya velum]